MDIEKKLLKHRYLWTTLREKIALFTVDCYGEQEYLIYHLTTKRIQLVAKSEVGQALVRRMIEHGVIILQDPPAELKSQRETAQVL